MPTISSLARQFGLSRSTLLYYDAIGLLKPSVRSAANYRQYSAADSRRLRQICLYREAGLPLAEIKRLLAAPGGAVADVLRKRLEELNQEIGRLRNQQDLLVRLLEKSGSCLKLPILSRSDWHQALMASGVTEAQLRRWHQEFEAMSPEGHLGFLTSLGLPPREIAWIRDRAAAADAAGTEKKSRK